MNLNRIKTLAVCLGVACLLLTGSALAGSTTTTVYNTAREVGAANAVYTLATTTVSRSMGVIRNSTQDFLVVFSMSGGVVFTGSALPDDVDLTVTNVGATISKVAGGAAGNSSVTYLVDVTTDNNTSFPSLTLDATGWTVKDVSNTLGGGGTVTASIVTKDSATGTEVDAGGDPANWLRGVYAVGTPVIRSTTATVDVATNRTNFVVNGDDLTVDWGAETDLDYNPNVHDLAGLIYDLLTADTIDYVVTGDLSGITSITVAGVTHFVTSTELTNGSATISLSGDAVPYEEEDIYITVDGTTSLSARTISVSVNLTLSGGTSGPTANDRQLLGSTTLSVWSLNGTVLISNFANGNNGVFFSRFYLWNPSATGGAITVRVYTLPLSGTSTLVGTVAAGTIGGKSGKNIRFAEDVLTPLAVTLPYVTDGGNLVVEITIEASMVNGFAQTFQPGNLLPFVSIPMVVIQ